jgi:hypothetical protein
MFSMRRAISINPGRERKEEKLSHRRETKKGAGFQPVKLFPYALNG